MEYTTFLNGYIPHVVGIPSGVLLFILSFYLARTVLAVVFGVVRRRVYLSENLFYLGLLMLSVSLPAAGVWGVTIVFLHHISKQEEKLLLARFGEDQANYIEEVPMWFPQSSLLPFSQQCVCGIIENPKARPVPVAINFLEKCNKSKREAIFGG